MYKKIKFFLRNVLFLITPAKYQNKFDPNEYNYPLNLASLKKLYFFIYTFSNRSGYPAALSREDQTLAQKNIFLTYGEVLPEGIEKLLEFVEPNSFDSFVDLGSGAGKIVLQSFLCSNMRACYGVEIDQARFNTSMDALTDLQQKLPGLFDNNRIIKFFNSNILECDFSEVTLVFSNATSFGPNLMSKIADKVNLSQSVRAIMSTHKIEGLLNLTDEYIIEVETSWHVPPAKSNCYLYLKP